MSNVFSITSFVGGIHYAKQYPEFMSFDSMKYLDESIDWSKYKRRGVFRELAKCNKVADKFFDQNRDFREEHIDDLKRITWYATVCMDELKYSLNRKMAYDDLGIEEILKRYSVI